MGRDDAEYIPGSCFYVTQDHLRTASQHWHTLRPHHTNFTVEGIVTDQLAQMVFNKVLGPKPPLKPAYLEHMRTTLLSKQQPMVCSDCPAGLLPFSIKRRAELVCTEGTSEKHVQFRDNTVETCPQWCLKEEPNGTVETNSGPLPIRNCAR